MGWLSFGGKMAESKFIENLHRIKGDTRFLRDQPIDLNGSPLTAWNLALIANVISKYGRVEVINAQTTGEEIDWIPSLVGLNNG